MPPSTLTVPESSPSGWWLVRRFLPAAVGIVLLSGGATALLALNEVSKIVAALGQNKVVKVAPKVLAATGRGTPETLLLVGNDERPPPKDNPGGAVLPHSNEMLLVRIDPSRPTISMLSIPRELWVPIVKRSGEVEENRINAAYTFGYIEGGGTAGGVELMLETLKKDLGITVNHVFITNFKKFKRAVNEMGCVYMTVDKRYYHSNSEPEAEQYFEINLQPGYQRLCGEHALEFVANRHESTSLIRDARDQRFLLEVKAEYGGSLFENREKFEHIIGKAVETDVHSEEQVLQLLELLVESAGKPVRQVAFPVTLHSVYDTATPQQIETAVHSFLHGTAPIPKSRLNHVMSVAAHARGNSAGLILTPTTSSELEKARSEAPSLPFPLEYPRARDSFAGAEPDMLRLYTIRDQQGHVHPIYTIVIDRGELGQYYDVQGTTWTDPPLLNNPSQTVRVGARDYELFYEGEEVRAIAWREAGAVYWIENTLTNNVSPRVMLAVAEETVPVIGANAGGASATALSSHDLNLAPRTTTATSLLYKLGAGLGFAGLALVAMLALLVLTRRRELRVLREQVAHAMALEARQRPLLAAAGQALVPIPASAPAAGLGQSPGAAGERAPTIYSTGRNWRRIVPACVGALIVGALIVFGAHRLYEESASTPSGPPLPVAVLNATTTQGAAHRVAGALGTRGVHVAQVGNINPGIGFGTGVYVLYPSGSAAESQARRLARLIPGLRPTVAVMQPQVQTAIGRHNEIVVVYDR